jgi:hypothetical protein
MAWPVAAIPLRLHSAAMPVHTQHHPRTWRQGWAVPAFRAALLAGCAVGAVVAVALPHFFAWIDARPGMVPEDPFLSHWGPRDVSSIIFTVLYGTLVVVLASIAKHPLRVLQGLYAYVLVLLLRMLAMTLLTFAPPPDIIPLVDPFTQGFYPGGTPFLKDLFFSGHTATLMLMALLAERRMVRWIAALATVAIGLLVLLQHVHWTVDVLAAIPAAWLAWKGAALILRRLGLSISAAAA